MYMFTYDTYIRLPTCILAPRDTCMHACMHTYIRITYIRKHYIHTHIRPPTRIPAAHAHTHAQTHHFSHQRHTQCARAQAVSLTHSLSRSPFPSHSLSTLVLATVAALLLIAVPLYGFSSLPSSHSPLTLYSRFFPGSLHPSTILPLCGLLSLHVLRVSE